MAKKKPLQVVEGIKPTEVLIVQIVPINMIDGNTGIAGLANDGAVYTYTGAGWLRLSMLEVRDDPKV